MTTRHKININYLLITIFTIVLIAMIVTLKLIPMDNLELSTLEKRISIIDKIAIFVIFLTLAASILSFTFKSQLNVLLKKEKENSELKIAKAEENAATAKRDAALAEEKSKTAVKDAAEANKKAAEIRERAANAEIKSKELEIELIKLRLQVGDRFLHPEIQDALSKDLIKYPPKTVSIYVNIANDSEPQKFAQSIKDFFVKIGWSAKIYNQNNIMIPAPTGMSIISTHENIPIIQTIGMYINAMKYEFKLSESDTLTEDLRIIIFARK